MSWHNRFPLALEVDACTDCHASELLLVGPLAFGLAVAVDD
jgi:hypothetical protein